MKKILILDRGSFSTDKYAPSRSVFCRIFEPLFFLRDQGLLTSELDVLKTEQVDADCIRNYHTVIFCKHNTEDAIRVLRLAKKNSINIIYDIDDLIHRFTSDSAAFHLMKNYHFVKELIESSDIVVASTERLKEVIALDFNLNKVVIIKTGINVEKYKKTKYGSTDKKILFTNGDNIKINSFRAEFIAMFNEFLNSDPEIQFKIFGDSEQYVRDFLRYDFLGAIPWNDHKRWLMNHQIEFAIIPLGSTEEDITHSLFSDCKTPIKYLEYGAMRIPGIYSNALIYSSVISSNETGILVDNNSISWGEALKEMHNNFSLRKKIADQAFEDVSQKHHINLAARKWLEIL